MLTTSVRMTINVSMIVRSRAPIRYITQVEGFGDWTIAGMGSAVRGGGAVVGYGGVIRIGDGGVGRGVNVFVGAGGFARGGSAGLAGGAVATSAAGESVVKAPAALQELRVLALMALTFQ